MGALLSVVDNVDHRCYGEGGERGREREEIHEACYAGEHWRCIVARS